MALRHAQEIGQALLFGVLNIYRWRLAHDPQTWVLTSMAAVLHSAYSRTAWPFSCSIQVGGPSRWWAGDPTYGTGQNRPTEPIHALLTTCYRLDRCSK